MLFSLRSDTHAVSLLKHDHEALDQLFSEFKKEKNNNRRAELASAICQSLSVHALIEEELFYPRALRALDAEKSALIREASVEHATLKGLISVLAGSSPRDTMFDAQMTVLMEYVKHHVREEEHELFPAVERTDADLEALGLKMKARKAELESKMVDRVVPRPGLVSVADLEAPAARPKPRPAPRMRKPKQSRAA